MDTYDISRSLDEEPSSILQSLISKDRNSLIQLSLFSEYMLGQFLAGKVSLTAIKPIFEGLTNIADRTVNIIQTQKTTQSEQPQDAIILDETSHVILAYKLVDSINSWMRNNYTIEQTLNEAKQFSELCRNLYRNITILENHFIKLPTHNVDMPSINKFNRLIIETLSTGAIALRPVALGDVGQPRRKRRRWFLQYVNR